MYYLYLNGHFPVEPELAKLPSFYFFHLFRNRIVDNWHKFFYSVTTQPGNSKHLPHPVP